MIKRESWEEQTNLDHIEYYPAYITIAKSFNNYIMLKGKLKVSAISIDSKSYEFVLDKPNQGIYIPNLTWANQLSLSDDCIYFIAASDYYKEDDYIRTWEVFKKIIK